MYRGSLKPKQRRAVAAEQLAKVKEANGPGIDENSAVLVTGAELEDGKGTLIELNEIIADGKFPLKMKTSKNYNDLGVL